jgi:hypothetical protein
MAKSRWIRTDCGWAGRRGYIMRAPQDNTCKYMYCAYGDREIIYADLISDLKKAADSE